MTKEQRAELQALKRMTDDRIDTNPDPGDSRLDGRQTGVFDRPVKQQVTLRLDSDVVTWFKTHAQGRRGYQTDINRALREHVRRCEKSAMGA